MGGRRNWNYLYIIIGMISIVLFIGKISMIASAKQIENDTIDSKKLYKNCSIYERTKESADAMYETLAYIQQQFPDRQVDTEANTKMAEWLVGELEETGYTVKAESFEQGGYSFCNYFVTKPGDSKKTIYVGAHYDSVNTNGIDDNGSGLSVVLELAKRFYSVPTQYTIRFCFFDGEESFQTKLGYAGSCNFCHTHIEERKQAVCYINIDSIAAGDYLFVYGGAWEDGSLTRTSTYQWARRTALYNGIDLHCLPEQVENPTASEAITAFRSPARETGSDHHYFNSLWKIPYIYIEANRWCEANGSGGNSKTNQTCHYQTNQKELQQNGGQIMHTPYDNLEKLEQLFPGRVRQHMQQVYIIVSEMLKQGSHRLSLFWQGSDGFLLLLKIKLIDQNAAK